MKWGRCAKRGKIQISVIVKTIKIKNKKHIFLTETVSPTRG